MRLELSKLQELHPRLAAGLVRNYQFFASMGLLRGMHSTGVTLLIADRDAAIEASLHWTSGPVDARETLDENRITEDAAEAIALVFVGVAKKWEVLRRMQREESADWLLCDAVSELVALEISGIMHGRTDESRMRRKLEQVSKCKEAQTRAACVVELSVPWTKLGFAP